MIIITHNIIIISETMMINEVYQLLFECLKLIKNIYFKINIENLFILVIIDVHFNTMCHHFT